jgi:hypothetical protein
MTASRSLMTNTNNCFQSFTVWKREEQQGEEGPGGGGHQFYDSSGGIRAGEVDDDGLERDREREGLGTDRGRREEGTKRQCGGWVESRKLLEELHGALATK